MIGSLGLVGHGHDGAADDVGIGVSAAIAVAVRGEAGHPPFSAEWEDILCLDFAVALRVKGGRPLLPVDEVLRPRNGDTGGLGFLFCRNRCGVEADPAIARGIANDL